MNLDEIPRYVIHSSERKDRLKNLNKELEFFKSGETIIVDAITSLKDTNISIAKSHKKCIEIALQNNYDNVLIMEDDVRFQSKTSREYADLCFNNLPDNYDVLLGGIYMSKGLSKENDYWLKTQEFSALHFYVVNKRAYKKILEFDTEGSHRDHIDRWMARTSAGELNCFVASPFFAIQYDGYSDNKQKDMRYSHLLNKFNILK